MTLGINSFFKNIVLITARNVEIYHQFNMQSSIRKQSRNICNEGNPPGF